MWTRYTANVMEVPPQLSPIQLRLKHRFQRRALKMLSRRSPKTIARIAGSALPVIRGRTLDPAIHLIAHENKRRRHLSTMTPPDARMAMEKGFAVVQAEPRAMKNITRHEAEGPHGSVPLYVYEPNAETPLPVIVYFHQGGCCIGSPRVVHPWCTELAEELPAIVVNVEYRLIPENPFPSPADDAISAYRWARDHAAKFGGDPDRMIVAGDSAGGLLSAYVTHVLMDAREPQPIAQLLIYPWLSIEQYYPSYQEFGESFPLDNPTIEWFRELGKQANSDFSDPRLSPVKRADLKGLAPAVIATAGFDVLCDEGDHYADRLAEAGVPVIHRRYDSLCHSFTAMGGAVPAARKALDEIVANLKQIVHEQPAASQPINEVANERQG